YKAAIAERAIDLGADIVNDVSGLTYDGALGGVAARRRAAIVLMHNRGRSEDMYRLASYGDVVSEVAAELRAAMDRAAGAGIPADRVILDPGFGFAKRAPQTLELFRRLDAIASVGRPCSSVRPASRSCAEG